MTVFYSTWYDGTFRYSFVRYLGEVITEADLSWWIVPGTLEDNNG